MKRFKNILVLADTDKGMKELITRACDMAERNDGNITIIDVQSDFSKAKRDVLSAENLDEINTAATNSALDRLKDLWNSYKSNIPDKRVKLKVLTGTPFLETIREILREDSDLLIKVAQEAKGLRPMLFGSTDMHLLRKCPCPLWIIKPTGERKYSEIMAAIDPEQDSALNEELNKKILDLATSVAKEENSELHIVHAWSFYGEITLQGRRIKLPEDKVNEFLGKIKSSATESVHNLLSRYDLSGIKHKVHILKGRPSEVLAQKAEKYEIDLLVMGTQAKRSVAGLFIGKTAEQALSRVNCSVLAVKPEGFKTPVKLD